MSGTWIFQANPKLYDIDGALKTLDCISWRVPQYTGEIAIGDVVVVWRSGQDAGIVGLGRVISEPEMRPSGSEENRFATGDQEGDTTRVSVRTVPVPFVPKADVVQLPVMSDHPIIRGPMGTVFRLDSDQWSAVARLLPQPPAATPVMAGAGLPRPFSWAQRKKSIHPMPGGYDGYLQSLAVLCDELVRQRPPVAEVGTIVRELFDVTDRRSALLTAFLRKVGVIVEDGGVTVLTHWATRWRATGDARIVVALLHSRVRFVGEMLAELRTPQTTSSLLRVANDRYGMAWSTKAQLDRRRGWLQSGGFVAVDAGQNLALTAEGEALLRELDVVDPDDAVPLHGGSTAGIDSADDADDADVGVGAGVPLAAFSETVVPPVERIASEVLASSTVSSDPARFERAIRDAFSFLGFRAEWLGGAGKTDVLLDAPLARGRSFRVIVDAKSSGTGSVTDQQIDWVTFAEHKVKHAADHVAVVAPNPSGQRLFDRAGQFGVVVFSAEQLTDLCHQHARAPLGLEAYRKLFRSGGRVDVERVAEDAEEWLRLVALARSVITTVAKRSARFGPLFARDLTLILDQSDAVDEAEESELQSILEMLASPLVGVVEGNRTDGYYVAMPGDVVAQRFELLGKLLANDGTTDST